jgi:hypothetical protein
MPPWLAPGAGAGYDLPAGGYVNEKTIDDFRQLIAAGVKQTLTRPNDFPPAISLHTAATISQWMSVPMFQYRSKVDASNTAFKRLSKFDPAVYSTGFRALLGVLFIDPKLPAVFADVTQLRLADAIAAEFHVQAQERGVLNSFANAVQPGSANAARVGKPNVDSQVQEVFVPALIDQSSIVGWQGCPHTFIVWAGHAAGMLN